MSRAPSPYEVYRLLPKKNCGECRVPTCIAFAVRMIRGEASPNECPYLTDDQRLSVERLVARPVRSVAIGVRRGVTVGGQTVLHRYEQRLYNTTAIAIDVDDRWEDDDIRDRVERIGAFRVRHLGRGIGVDMVAVRGASDDAGRLRRVASLVNDCSELPQVLCSYNPSVIEGGLDSIGDERPLIYAATRETLDEFIDMSRRYGCPLVLNSSDPGELRMMALKAIRKGVEPILDPTSRSTVGAGLTLRSLVLVRRAAIEFGYSELGLPLLGNPSVAYAEVEDPGEALWREALLALLFMTRYADILILHSLDVCSLLPLLVWRQGLYRDPRAPDRVDAGLYAVGSPGARSPVLLTTNCALTYYAVVSDVEPMKVGCYVLVVDTDGLDVLSAIGAGRLTADAIADAIVEAGIGDKVRHRRLIIPGKAARLRGEIEDLTGWRVLVGPTNSRGIPRFLRERWPEG